MISEKFAARFFWFQDSYLRAPGVFLPRSCSLDVRISSPSASGPYPLFAMSGRYQFGSRGICRRLGRESLCTFAKVCSVSAGLS